MHTVGAVGGVLRELHNGIGLQRIDDGRKGRSGRLLDRDVVLVQIRRNGGVDVARQEVWRGVGAVQPRVPIEVDGEVSGLAYGEGLELREVHEDVELGPYILIVRQTPLEEQLGLGRVDGDNGRLEDGGRHLEHVIEAALDGRGGSDPCPFVVVVEGCPYPIIRVVWEPNQ